MSAVHVCTNSYFSDFDVLCVFSPECQQVRDVGSCPFPMAEFLLNDGKKVSYVQCCPLPVCSTVHPFPLPSLPLPRSLLPLPLSHCPTPPLSTSLTLSSFFPSPPSPSLGLPRSLLPLSLSPLQLLSSGQYYEVSLQLQVPENPVNEDIGVFMINITFYTTGNQFLSTSARPVN